MAGETTVTKAVQARTALRARRSGVSVRALPVSCWLQCPGCSMALGPRHRLPPEIMASALAVPACCLHTIGGYGADSRGQKFCRISGQLPA